MKIRLVIATAGSVLALTGCASSQPTEPVTVSPTSVPAQPDSVSLAVIGDFGHGGPDQYAVAESIASDPPDYLVTTGDNFYSDDIELIWTGPYGWTESEGVEVIAAWGNHDIESSRRQELVIEHLGSPPRWYSRSLGPVRLIVLDSNQPSDNEQRRWLADEFTGSDTPAIVVFHHPFHSCGAHGSSDEVQEWWGDLLADEPVVLVLNGHDHDYERFFADGIQYVVTGGGGRPLRPLEMCGPGVPEPVARNDTDHHFVRLLVRDNGIEAEVVTADGRHIDTFEIELSSTK